MPKFILEDIDATGNVQQNSISNTVFVPLRGYEATAVFDPTLCTSVASLEAIAGIDEDKLDYKIAKHLLEIGLYVLVQGVVSNLTTAQWGALADKGLYDIRFLTNGVVELTEDSAIPSDMIACAKNRGDCVALCNLNERAEEFNYAEIQAAFAAAIATNGEYAAGFTPWFKASSIADGENDYIPAAFGYLFAYANSTKNNNEWDAVAGFRRGIIPELNDVKHDYSAAEIDTLQCRTTIPGDANDNVGVAVNPIANIRPAGYIIYGNRTGVANNAATKLTANSFLNVRNMVCMVKKKLYDACRVFAFEQNTKTLWINFQAYVKPLLDVLQTGNGILGYKFIQNPTTAKATLSATLKIVPVEAVEDFNISIYMTDDAAEIN